MSQVDNAREPTEPTAIPGLSGASETVTMSRAALEELIASSVQRALGQKQDSTPESGASGGECLSIM